MDKLRVGGPCVWDGRKRWVVKALNLPAGTGAPALPRPLRARIDNGRYAMTVNICPALTPAPFIPGDVVSLPGLIADCPRYSRGIATSGERNGHIFVTWQDGAQDLCLAEKLTLILPAQEARDAR